MYDILKDFATHYATDIRAFDACFQQTDLQKQKIRGLWDKVPPFSSDVDMIVYGSVARRESVPGSDVDWTLLVDGQADANHFKMASDIIKKFTAAKLNEPGSTGLFGQITFSHELIHHIGGQSDTNHNLTKRILLLLESERIVFSQPSTIGGTAYERILKGIISQYVEHDSGLDSNRPAVPRFLLNDIVRFWRTMCVDFAYKQREQEGKKWALRNLKLRISRKMVFVKGLLMCLSNYGEGQDKADLCNKLLNLVHYTPVEMLIRSVDIFQLDGKIVANLIGHYNRFLEKLNDGPTRAELEKMNMQEVYKNESFIDLRNTGDGLQKCLDQLFIQGNNQLQFLTLKYGIF